MPWFRVDDGFWGHPRRLDLPMSAIGLWAVSGSWAARHLTDGFVPRSIMPILGGKPRDIKALTDAGMWIEQATGWQFRDWDHYQKTKVQVERDRELARKRMGRSRNGYKEIEQPPEQPGEVTPDVRANFDGSSTSHTNPTQASPLSTSVELLGGDSVTREQEPPLFCKKHPNGHDGPCGGCADARRLHTVWLAVSVQRTEQAKRELAAAVKSCPNHCINGWIEDTDSNPIRKCNHQAA
jgi:hypothetical protein